jgi:hypothetical protein
MRAESAVRVASPGRWLEPASGATSIRRLILMRRQWRVLSDLALLWQIFRGRRIPKSLFL